VRFVIVAVVPGEFGLDDVAGFQRSDRVDRLGIDIVCVGLRVIDGWWGDGDRAQISVGILAGCRSGSVGEIDQQDRAIRATVKDAKPAGRRRLHTAAYRGARISPAAWGWESREKDTMGRIAIQP